MHIIHRYILKEALVFFAISLFAFTGILLTLKMLSFAAMVVDKGVELRQIATVFLAIIPTFLEIAVPLSTLLGIMLALARLSGDSEIVVMKASGISIYQLIVPIVTFGALTTLFGMLVSQQLKPWGYRTLSTTLFDIARTKSTAGLEQGIFNKLGNLTLYADGVNYQTGALERVLIDDRRSADERKIVIAHRGKIYSDLATRSIVLLLKEGEIHEIVNSKYAVTNFITNSITINADELVAQDAKQGKNLNELYIDELRERRDYLSAILPFAPETEEFDAKNWPQPIPESVGAESSSKKELKKRVLRTKVELAQRFSLPFAALALALLALPLGIQPPRAQRAWGAGISALLGLLVFVLYYGIFSVVLVLAQNRSISPSFGLSLPNLTVLGLALWFIYKTGSEQWQSVATRLQEFMHAIRRRLPRLRRRRPA